MKPIIQGALDALEARIRALEVSLQATSARVVSLNATLSAVIGSGRLWVNRQVLIGSGTYEPTHGTKRALVRMVGGGGGGGGANSVIGSPDSTGAGGNSGWYLEFRVSGSSGLDITGGSFSCGAIGAGGLNTPTDGSAGGNTVLTINGTTYTATGGTGGGSLTDANADPTAPAACPSTGSVDFFFYGPGSCGIPTGGGLAYCGMGGSVAPFGSGGFQVNAGPGTGGPGLGYGAGGAGGCADFFSIAGAPGAPGRIVIDEFL